MKKYSTLIIIFIFSAIFVNTVSSFSDTLLEGETKTYFIEDYEYEIKLKYVTKWRDSGYPYATRFELNGKPIDIRQEGGSQKIGGTIFTVDKIHFKESPEASSAEFTVDKQENCGNNMCVGEENCISCPQDCGCKSGYVCSRKICKLYTGCGDNECNRYETCNEDSCCDGKTTNFDIDNKNCGVCGNVCNENYICEEGTCVFNIKDELSYYPQFFVKNNNLDVVIVVGDKAPSSHVIAQTQVALSLSSYSIRHTGKAAERLTMLASEIDDIDNFDIISVGNACDNEVSAEILENPEPCNNLERGEATIEIYKSKRNKAHIVLNAYSDEGVKKAAEVLSRYLSYNLKGNKFIIDVDELEVEIEETQETEQGNEEDERQKIIEELNEKISSQEKKIEEKEILEEETIENEGIKIEAKEPQQTTTEGNLIKKIAAWFFSLFK